MVVVVDVVAAVTAVAVAATAGVAAADAAIFSFKHFQSIFHSKSTLLQLCRALICSEVKHLSHIQLIPLKNLVTSI